MAVYQMFALVKGIIPYFLTNTFNAMAGLLGM